MNFNDIDTKKLPAHITFTCKDTKIEILEDGFFFNGEKVEDKEDVYTRFNKWLKLAIEEQKK